MKISDTLDITTFADLKAFLTSIAQDRTQSMKDRAFAAVLLRIIKALKDNNATQTL